MIYLAETTPDLYEERERIRRELEQAGHQILPDAPLPDPPAFEQTVCQGLAQSVLSVHLLGPGPAMSALPENITLEQAYQNMAFIRTRDQIELARQCSERQANFSRILWLPPGKQILGSDEFIQALQNEPDFISTNLESLKDIIHDRLTQPLLSIPDIPEDGTVKVYLDCDERDLEAPEIEPVYEWLTQNFRVVLPDHDKNSLTHSEDLLRQCEAVLIFYGQASELWLKRRLLALKKTLYDRPKPLRAKAIYLADSSKQLLTDPDVLIIQGFRGFHPDLLTTFLEQLA
ncbi:MAG: hypothetical protein EA342_18420 [Leptolyngbya sp. LCM1.Bin17]|nr:MAG: hypothetical protein EA342_18420 [Leptolyngbya sp. LCM1.Bin17]